MAALAEFPAQSSAADWNDDITILADDDGLPYWSTVPGDLVVTMTLIEDGFESSSLVAASNDGSGMITALPNGVIDIAVPAATMAGLAHDPYGVQTRYRAFIKIETGGATMQAAVAVLPVYRGA